MLATLRFNAIIARVIKDAKKWNLGISKLSAFMTFTHEPFDEDKVGDFHAIITTLEEAFRRRSIPFQSVPRSTKTKSNH